MRYGFKMSIYFIMELYFSIFILFCIINNHNEAKDYKDETCHPKSNYYSPCKRNLDAGQPISDILYKTTPYANIWLYLMNTKCHKDLPKLLCGIHAPQCRKSFRREQRLPCQRMCRDVETECLPHVSVYGYKWPMEANCSVFPHINCLDLTNPFDSGYYNNHIKRQRGDRSSKNRERSILLKSTNGELQKHVKKQREDRSLSNVSTILSDEEIAKQQMSDIRCTECHAKTDLQTLAKEICRNSVVVKAKIQAMFRRSKRESLALRLHHNSKILTGKISSRSGGASIATLVPEVHCIHCVRLMKKMTVTNRNRKRRRSLIGRKNKDRRKRRRQRKRKKRRKRKQNKWLLLGNPSQNAGSGHGNRLNVAYAVKWRRRNKKMRILVRRLTRSRSRWCGNINQLIKVVQWKAAQMSLSEGRGWKKRRRNYESRKNKRNQKQKKPMP